MQIDLKEYCQNVIKEYEHWARSRLPFYMGQKATRAKDEDSPEMFLVQRRKARFKQKKESPDSFDLPFSTEKPDFEKSADKTESMSVFDLINDQNHRKTILLGDPGMGKSSLFWIIAKNDAKILIDNPDASAPLPLRYNLSSYARHKKQGLDLVSQLGKRMIDLKLLPADDEPASLFRKVFDNKPMRILLDGLNEVEGESRDFLIEEIESLSRDFVTSKQKHFFIISSRLHERLESIPGFLYADLFPLDYEVACEYIKICLASSADKVLIKIEQGNLKQIILVPLFLYLITKMHEDSPEAEIPPNRARLLQKLIMHGFLIEHEEKLDNALEPTLKRDQCALLVEKIAYNALEKDTGLEISREEIQNALTSLKPDEQKLLPPGIDPDACIESICGHGILEFHQTDVYTFWHPIMRDYFAGAYIASLWRELKDSKEKENFLRAKIKFSRWDQAISIAVGLSKLEQAQEIEDFTTEIAPFFSSIIYGYNKEGIENKNKQIYPTMVYQKLRKIQQNSIEEIAHKAIECWGNIATIEAIKELIKTLEDENWQYRNSAVLMLGKIKAIEAVPSLINVLKSDKNLDVRGSAAFALGEIKTTEVIKELIRVLMDKDEAGYVKGFIARAIVKNFPQAITPDITTSEITDMIVAEHMEYSSQIFVENDKHEYTSYHIDYDRVRNMKSPIPIINQIRMLENKTETDYAEYMITMVAEIIEKINSPAAVPELINALNDRQEFVRRAAASALGRIRSLDALPELIKMLNNKNEKFFVRMSAARALGRIGSPKAVESLLRIINEKDDEEMVRGCAAVALADTKSQYAAKELIKMLAKRGDPIRSDIIIALGMMKFPEVVPILLNCLEDENESIRYHAALSIGEIKLSNNEKTENLLKILKRKGSWLHNKKTRESVWQAIFAIEEYQGIRWLVEVPWWGKSIDKWILNRWEGIKKKINDLIETGAIWTILLIIFALIFIIFVLLDKPELATKIKEILSNIFPFIK